MDEDDDDLYDPADSFPPPQEQNNYNQTTEDANGADSYEFEEEEDDDDFNIITEAPADAAPNLTHPRHATLINEPQRSASAEIKPSLTPSIPVKAESVTPTPGQGRPVATLKSGAAYPPIHTSTIDVNANPIHPTSGKPITSTDLDADFPTEEDKPWRLPGSDISDFFNYGFDEFTWASYCLKQQDLRKDVTDQKKQLEEMQAFMSMGGMPGMPGAPTPTPAPPAQNAGGGGMPAMPGMPGMPDMSPDMMQGMLAGMMAQGLDPSAMDPMTFMQHVQAMMGGGQPGGQQNQGYSGQGNQQQMGYGGYNQQGGYGGGRGRGGGRRW